MFDIFLKKSKIVVDCFTTNAAIHEFYPIESAKQFMPGWWKRMSPTVMRTSNVGISYPEGTLKRCDGFLDLFQQGFILPLWSDVIIETTANGNYKYQFPAAGTPPIVNHTRDQMSPDFNHLMHLKLISPWVIEEKTGVKFHLTQPTWTMLDHVQHMTILPGVVNYKNQVATHVNMFVPIQDRRFELEAGQPLAQIVPISDKKVEVRNHLITDSEFEQRMVRTGFQTKWFGNYKRYLKMARQG